VLPAGNPLGDPLPGWLVADEDGEDGKDGEDGAAGGVGEHPATATTPSSTPSGTPSGKTTPTLIEALPTPANSITSQRYRSASPAEEQTTPATRPVPLTARG